MKKQKTKKQAKKANLVLLFVMLIIGAVVIALGYFFDLMIIGLIFGGCFILTGLYVCYSWNRSIKHSYCPKCDAKYDYDADISWAEEDRIDSDTKITSIVEFTCKCRSCGAEETFKEKFIIANYDKEKGVWKEHNLSQLAKKHFIK